MEASRRSLLLWPPPEEANPYLRKLADALTQRGVAVRSSPRLAALCARPGDATALHLHWPEWMLQDRSRARYIARTRWQLGLLDLARSRGLRLAWTAHNLLGHDDPHPDLGVAARRALLSRCAVVFGHFARAEDDLRAWGFRGRFVAAAHPAFGDEHPYPFADAAARLRWRRARGITDDATLLVSPGSMEPYKNLAALAGALRASTDPSLRWIAAGRCPPSVRRALADATGDDPRLRVEAGFQSRASLAQLVAAADAVVLAHKDFYTTGVAVLAAALGAPLIAPPRHQLASWRSMPFFAPLEAVRADALGRAVVAVRAMGHEARAAARAFARAYDWASMAAATDGALFGAPS